jgi:hypothetical protein
MTIQAPTSAYPAVTAWPSLALQTHGKVIYNWAVNSSYVLDNAENIDVVRLEFDM